MSRWYQTVFSQGRISHLNKSDYRDLLLECLMRLNCSYWFHICAPVKLFSITLSLVFRTTRTSKLEALVFKECWFVGFVTIFWQYGRPIP